MISRDLTAEIVEALDENPAVVLLGPRQVGKTTLAHEIASGRPSIYLDLERPSDMARLQDPELYLRDHLDKLVILDEVHRVPELFGTLRGLIDEARRLGRGDGRYLLLGSASMELMNQSSESLAGRVAYRELAPVTARELDEDNSVSTLWERGGFPRSLLAPRARASVNWRRDFIRTYLERDIPQLGTRIPAETLRRFWTMLAHHQGGLFNASEFGRSLGVDSKTVANYRDLMIDLLLVRKLMPWHRNTKKRLVKSPKVYVRDSGLCHTLLGIDSFDALLGHPVLGGSWEGFVVENIAAAGQLDPHQLSFYRATGGAEIDLLVERGGEIWAIEIKRTSTPKLTRGFHSACEDLQPARAFFVYGGQERYRLADGVEAIGLRELLNEVSASRAANGPYAAGLR